MTNALFDPNDNSLLEALTDAELLAGVEEHRRLGSVHYDYSAKLKLAWCARQRERAGLQIETRDRCPYGCDVSGYRPGWREGDTTECFGLCRVHRLCWWIASRERSYSFQVDVRNLPVQPWQSGELQEYREVAHPQQSGEYHDGTLFSDERGSLVEDATE